MDKRQPNPNSTIQLDAIVLDDEDADAALVESTRPGPPPLPPSELASKSSAPSAAPSRGSAAPPPANARPAWVAPVALVVGLGVAIFAGVKVGSSLHDARAAKEAANAPPAPAPSVAAPPPAANSASAAPVIAVPVVEMDDKPPPH